MAAGIPNGVDDTLLNVTYGFIGIGVMGFPMAQKLRSKIPRSSKLIICDLVESQVKKFLSQTEATGEIEVAQTPKEVAEQASIVITMLPKGPHVHTVFTEPSTGLLSANLSKNGIFFMECSTIDTATSLAVNALASSHGHRFVDAPVSGGPNGALAGSLTFMIGGTATLFAESLPLARAMGNPSHIYHCGAAGAGLATKQINNYLSAVCMLGTSEAFDIGQRYGLDPKVLARVINASTGMNYNSSAQNPVKGVTATASSARDFKGGFSIELCTGVIGMALELGKEVGAKSVLGEMVKGAFEEASLDERCKGKDCRSIYRWVADV